MSNEPDGIYIAWLDTFEVKAGFLNDGFVQFVSSILGEEKERMVDDIIKKHTHPLVFTREQSVIEYCEEYGGWYHVVIRFTTKPIHVLKKEVIKKVVPNNPGLS